MSDLKTKYFIPKSILDKIKGHLNQQFERNVEIVDPKEIAGWFMGTRGENLSEVTEIISSVLTSLLKGRQELNPEDPYYITETVKSSAGYKKGMTSVIEQTDNLLSILNAYSLPTQSLRYQGHMLWDISLPSLVGSSYSMSLG
jgi:hypothetical protein